MGPLIVGAGLLFGGLAATKTVTDIKKNLRDSSGRKQADSLAVIAQADQEKFNAALSALQHQDDNRVWQQLSNSAVLRAQQLSSNDVLREIERTRAACHRADTRLLQNLDNNRLAAHRENNRLLRALEESRRMSQSELTELLQKTISSWQDERMMLFNAMRADQQTIIIILVVIAALTFLLGKSQGELEQLERFFNFHYSDTALATRLHSLARLPDSEEPVARFFYAAFGGAGLIFVIGPGWTFSSYIINSIGNLFHYFPVVGLHRTLNGHRNNVTSVTFSPDGTKIVSGSEDRSVRIWDAATGTSLREHKDHIDPVSTVRFSADGKKILSCSTYRSLRNWDVDMGDQATGLSASHAEPFICSALSSDGTRVASDRTKYDWIETWDATVGKRIESHTGHGGPVLSVAYSSDDTKFASGSADGSVRIFRTSSTTASSVLKGHGGGVHCVAFSPDQTQLVSGSDDGLVRLWYVGTARLLEAFTGHADSVRGVAFSFDGARIVSGSDDGTVRLWDVVARVPLQVLEGHTSGIRSVAFSPDNAKVVSGSDDRSLRIWNVAV